MSDPYNRDPRLKNFGNFVYAIWQHLRLPAPTPIQYDIAKYLQSGPRRRMVEGFRGVAKSYITACLVLYRLYWNPALNCLVVSASDSRASAFTVFVLRLISEVEWLRWLHPNATVIEKGDDEERIIRKSMKGFDVGPAPASQSPSVKSVGIFGQITGSRADLIVADDIEVTNNSDTPLKRDKLSEGVREFDAVLKPGGEVIFLGTPQTEQSLYNILPERGYDIRIWPVEYPDPATIANYNGRLAPFIIDPLLKDLTLAGKPTDPSRFDELDLAERRASWGRNGYRLQFMLDTTMSDADRYPLKLPDFLVMDLNPDSAPEKVVWANSPDLVIKDLTCVGFNRDRYYRPLHIQGDWIPYTGRVMHIDPAGKGPDELTVCVSAFLNGYIYILKCCPIKDKYDPDGLLEIARIAKSFKVNEIVYEANFGDVMFGSLLLPVLNRRMENGQPYYPCRIEQVKHSRQKELRIIDTVEPVLSGHKLIIDSKVLEEDYRTAPPGCSPEEAHRYRLAYQLSRITREKGSLAHDDRLDVMAMAVAYWQNHVSKDADRAILDRQEVRFHEELEQFLEGAICTVAKPSSPNWLAAIRG